MIKINKLLRESIIESIIEIIKNRFASDDELVRIIEPSNNFRGDANLKEVHELFGKGLDLSSLHLQYKELVEMKTQLELGSNLITNIHVQACHW